jgi:DNA (cytosine-5)-methyltransferase 1
MENPLDLLASVAARYSQKEIAALLGVDARTVRRWQTGQTEPPHYLADAIRQRLLPAVDAARPLEATFAFVDMYAGVGAIRLGFEAHGGRCVFASENDPFAQKTYLANFPDGCPLAGGLGAVDERDVPDHDILLVGSARQSFGPGGGVKANAPPGESSFADAIRGGAFGDLARIVRARRPRAFVLEDSKNLLRDDGGSTFRTFREVFEDQLGYRVHAQVVDALPFVPQRRECLLVAGFREPTLFSWDDLQRPRKGPDLTTVLHPQDGSEMPEAPYTAGPMAKVDARYTLSEDLWHYLQRQARGQRAAGRAPERLQATDIARALTPRYYKDGSDILVSQRAHERPRRLTPRECARLMGFPDSFAIPVSDTQAYRQFGRSAVVPVMREVARLLVPRVVEQLQQEKEGVQQAPLIAGSA